MDRITLNAIQGAAGVAGVDPVSSRYVEDVFSTYMYEGNNTTGRNIVNGIALGETKPEDGNSLNLSATHQRLIRTSALSGASASKTFTFSAWVKIPDTSVTGYLFYIQDDNESNRRFEISIGSNLQIGAWNSSNYKFLEAYGAVLSNPGEWNHILISFDMTSTSNRYCYINDSSVSLTWDTYWNDSILFNSSEVAIFGEKRGMPWNTNTGSKLFGSLSNFYFDQTYRDLSTTSERRKFYAADGTPATGQASLSPIIYYNCDTLSTTNAGSGGDFTFIDSPTLNDFGPYIGYTPSDAKGGLVWIKKRNVQRFNVLVDTERGANKVLESDTQGGTNNSGLVTGFNSNGFEVDNHQNVNASSGPEDDAEYVSWTFRKAPGFFDVVTYTGSGGTGQNVPHSLDSVPGMIIVKQTSDSGENWHVQHRYDTTKKLYLNTEAAESSGSDGFDNTAPTSSVFTVRYNGTNKQDESYVAYIFAHDDQRFGTDEDESIIKCGTFEATAGTEVNLGFEPQFLLIKTIDNIGGWFLIDNMRGVSHDYVVDSNFLYANSDADEDDNRSIFITSTGFEVCSSHVLNLYNAHTYIYMAIRRGPMKTPEAATEVFDLKANTGDFSGSLTSTSVLADVVLSFGNPSSGDIEKYWMHRQNYVMLIPHTTTSSTDGLNYWSFDHNAGAIHTGYWGNGSFIDYTFRRAPGFFDVVFYPGDGSAHTSPNTINHNLGVSPELIIIKRRNDYTDWKVWTTHTGTYLGTFNTSATFGSDFQIKNATTTTFDVGTDGAFEHTNAGTGHHIAYLFASLAGVSKVGTYDGTGSDLNVDCGFTAGARFVLIKRTDSTGDWLYWDTIRGIVSGNESAFPLNGTIDENTSWSPGAGNWGVDWLDPLSTGFTVTSGQPFNAAVNAIGGTYIYLAIA